MGNDYENDCKTKAKTKLISCAKTFIRDLVAKQKTLKISSKKKEAQIKETHRKHMEEKQKKEQ